MADKRTEDLIRKIRALRAKAEDSSTTEAEASSFAAKVAELLQQHGLAEAQLVEEEQSPISHERYVHEWTSPARRLLALAVCQLYMVRPIIDRGSRPWILIGRPHGVLMVKEMTSYLVKTTTRLSNEWKRANPAAPSSDRIDYRRGMYERLAERLREMRKQKDTPQYTPQGNPGNLPALYASETKLCVAYMRAHFQTAPSRGIRLNVGSAGQQGRAASDRVGLSPQIRAGSGALMIGKR